MGLDVCYATIHIHRLFEVYGAGKIVLISGVSVGGYETQEFKSILQYFLMQHIFYSVDEYMSF
jgi:hypothetical protein